MNDDQITSLAREYAEEKGKKMEREQSLPNCLIKEVMEMDAKELTNFLQWMLRRYCLVEKSKLEEGYKSSKHYFEHTDSSNPTQKQYFWGRICAIESLFPELAKEVEK